MNDKCDCGKKKEYVLELVEETIGVWESVVLCKYLIQEIDKYLYVLLAIAQDQNNSIVRKLIRNHSHEDL
jgi:hypothetical protein